MHRISFPFSWCRLQMRHPDRSTVKMPALSVLLIIIYDNIDFFNISIIFLSFFPLHFAILKNFLSLYYSDTDARPYLWKAHRGFSLLREPVHMLKLENIYKSKCIFPIHSAYDNKERNLRDWLFKPVLLYLVQWSCCGNLRSPWPGENLRVSPSFYFKEILLCRHKRHFLLLTNRLSF